MSALKKLFIAGLVLVIIIGGLLLLNPTTAQSSGKVNRIFDERIPDCYPPPVNCYPDVIVEPE